MRHAIAAICLQSFLFLSPDATLAASQSPGPDVAAAAPAPHVKEPERFAFIVGNSRYQKGGSNLQDLTDTCDEAVQFRNRLLAIGWQEDHLYPRVAPMVGGGQASSDAQAAAVCDKTSSDLQKQLGEFVAMIMRNTNNPYAVVYFAGHGAQSNGQFYGFGVDSWVDLDDEMSLLHNSSSYEVFSSPTQSNQALGPTAVNLSRLVALIDGKNNGKAALMIVDACRNDPIFDEFFARLTIPKNLSPEEAQRYWMGYLGGMDQYDSRLIHVMFMFAGGSGQMVGGSAASDANWLFGERLRQYMQADSKLSLPTVNFVSGFETLAKAYPNWLHQDDRQIPRHVGGVPDRPVFCFKGCPQPLADWNNERDEIIGEAPKPATVVASADHAGRAHAKQARYVRAAWRVDGDSAAEAAPAPAITAHVVPSPPPDSSPVVAARPINLDVFYCAGDSFESKRQAAARDFAEATRRSAPRELVVADTFIDQVRLRSLDVNVNLSMPQPKTGTSLVLSSNIASDDWAKRLKGGFDRVYTDQVTPGYIRAYFCAGFSPKTRPRPLVYTQVSRASQVPMAQATIGRLSAGLPALRFIDQVEAVDETRGGKSHAPDATELRCYGPGACAQAEMLASALRSQLSSPVKVIGLHGPVASTARNPVIELWFGSQVLADWADPAHP